MSARPISYIFWFFAAVAAHAGLIFAWSNALDLRPEYGVELGQNIEITLVEPLAEPAAERVIESTPPPKPDLVPPPPEPVPEPIPEPSPPAEPEMIEPPPPLPKPATTPRPSRRAVTPAAPATLPRGVTRATSDSGDRSGARTNAKPNYLSNPPPPYPVASKEAHEEGVALLTVAVNEQGRAASVRLHRSSGFPRLDGAALRAVRGWRFSPARIGGIPVSAEVQVPVRFQLK